MRNSLPLLAVGCVTLAVLIPATANAATINSNGTGGGDWNLTSTWSGGVVPGSGDAAVIVSGDVVTLTTHQTVGSFTIDAGGEYVGSTSTNLNIASGGAVTVNGTWTNAASNLDNTVFLGSGTVSGTVAFGRMQVQGSVDVGTGTTIKRSLDLFGSSAAIVNNSPGYATSGGILYRQGTSANIGVEWGPGSTLGDPGVPHSIQVNSSGTDISMGSVDRTTGNLSVVAGATLNATSGTLTLKQSVNFAGSIGSISGTFNHNNGTIFITNSAEFTTTSPGTDITLNNLTIDGGTTLRDDTVNPLIPGSITVLGTLTNNGKIRGQLNPSGTGSFSMGMTGATVDITTLGTLSALIVDRIDSNHPNALPSNSTGIYWDITPTGSGYTLDLTVPDSVSDPYLTRWNGASWDAPARTSDNGGSVTLTGITTLSDWTVNDGSAVVPIELSTFQVK